MSALTYCLGTLLCLLLTAILIIAGFVIEELIALRKNRKFEDMVNAKRGDLN
jgi:cell division protein FtsX